MRELHEVNWSLLGSTDEYKELKERLAHVVRDVVSAACIKEIIMSDIVSTFKEAGYKIVPEEAGK